MNRLSVGQVLVSQIGISGRVEWYGRRSSLSLCSCRRESNCHMAKRWGCCEVEPPSELLFYVPELRLANLRTGWLLRGTEFSRLSDPECHHPGPTGRCHTATVTYTHTHVTGATVSRLSFVLSSSSDDAGHTHACRLSVCHSLLIFDDESLSLMIGFSDILYWWHFVGQGRKIIIKSKIIRLFSGKSDFISWS